MSSLPKQAGFVFAFFAAGICVAQGAASGCVPITIHVDPAAVVASCTEALAAPDLSAQQRATFLQYRGRGHKALKNFSAAEKDFNAGLELTPDSVALHTYLGWVAYDRRDVDALKRITAALAERFPNESSVRDFLGAIARLRGELGIAHWEYDRALELDPESVLALNHRAQLFWHMGAHEAALADMQALSISKNPEVDDRFDDFHGRKISFRTLARLDRVRLLENLGHTERIERELADFAKVEPGFVSYGWWGVYCQRRSQFDCAREKLEKALTYDPDFWFLHSWLSNTLLYTKQYEAALQSIDRAIALNPDVGSLHYQRALALRELGRVDEAIEDAVRSIHIEPAFMGRLGPKLVKLGYLQPETKNADLVPMFNDALRACMLDERCW